MDFPARYKPSVPKVLLFSLLALVIGALQLDGRAQVERSREALEKLAQMSETSLITGSLAPEDDAVFALLRFVQEGAEVIVQTAVAEA